MKLHELKNTFNRQARKRVGRGDGSGNGRTAGRGDKGAGARAGAKRRPYFEGGQIPLIRRLPKRGFNNPNHVLFEVVNLNVLEENFEAGAEINREVLEQRGLISKETRPLKVLANGDLTKAFKVSAENREGGWHGHLPDALFRRGESRPQGSVHRHEKGGCGKAQGGSRGACQIGFASWDGATECRSVQPFSFTLVPEFWAACWSEVLTPLTTRDLQCFQHT